jgi:uncharacterized protein (TIGR02145 family)
MKKVLFLILILALFSCKKPKDGVPTLTTTEITKITGNSATSGGNIIDEGSGTITARGVCWSKDITPTIKDNKTSDGAGAGTFTSSISGLSIGTTYYTRAYATNSSGTGYGMVLSFSTPIADFDGNFYHTIKIGSQIWMVENLKTTKYSDGNPISNITSNTQWGSLTTGAYCDYNNDKTNSDTYGRLYNWYAINSEKLCPTGSHVSTYTEWATIILSLGGDTTLGGSLDLAGCKLKEAGVTHWWGPNIGATNEVGFTALPGAYRKDDGTWGYTIGVSGFWWTSTRFRTNQAKNWYLDYRFKNAYWNNLYNNSGFSVRCVID